MSKLFKGYILTDGKKAKEKFKDKVGFKTLEDVQKEWSYAGVLANDVVLIDIDDREQAEILMNIIEDFQLNCRVHQTEKGKHFLFYNCGIKKCDTRVKLACGITADIKIGSNNSYCVLKLDGKERFVEWDVENGDYQQLPKWLFPVKSSIDFFDMKAGDGRNDALFKYILNLNCYGFSKEESRECLKIINKYVLKESLSEKEIETITRDEAFPKETFYEGKTFLHNNFAAFLKNNDHIKRINGQLYVYRDGYYIPGMREIEAAMVKYLPNLKAAQRVEVWKYLDILCSKDELCADANLIAFENGIFNIATNELLPFSPEIVITNKIPWNYISDAYSELADKTLNKIACNDEAIRALLEESIGYSFYRRNELSKAFFLTGEGSNGKSTFLDLLNNLVGKKNRSALGLDELEERFSIATLGDKLINTGDDIPDDFLHGRATAIFKKIVSGNEVKGEFKGQDPFFFKPYTKLFFSANTLPRVKSKGFNALKRRLIIIPFNAKFSMDNPDYDPYITWKLRDEAVMNYLVKLGIEGLKRVLVNNSFTKSEKVKRELEEYEKENNPILLFIDERDANKIINQPCHDVFRAYRIFCTEKGFMEQTLPNFSKEINRLLNLKTKRVRINGSLTGVYVKK